MTCDAMRYDATGEGRVGGFRNPFLSCVDHSFASRFCHVYSIHVLLCKSHDFEDLFMCSFFRGTVWDSGECG